MGVSLQFAPIPGHDWELPLPGSVGFCFCFGACWSSASALPRPTTNRQRLGHGTGFDRRRNTQNGTATQQKAGKSCRALLAKPGQQTGKPPDSQTSPAHPSCKRSDHLHNITSSGQGLLSRACNVGARQAWPGTSDHSPRSRPSSSFLNQRPPAHLAPFLEHAWGFISRQTSASTLCPLLHRQFNTQQADRPESAPRPASCCPPIAPSIAPSLQR